MLVVRSLMIYLAFVPTSHRPVKPSAVYYSSYLELPHLLQLNHPVTREHDEIFFISVHQVSELYFKQVLNEFELMQSNLFAYEEHADTAHLKIVSKQGDRVVKIWELLVANLRLLRSTMEPASFAKFRHSLGSASGYQSVQFRQIELLLGLEVSERALNSLNSKDRQLVDLSSQRHTFPMILRRILEHVEIGDTDEVMGNTTDASNIEEHKHSDTKRPFAKCIFPLKVTASALLVYVKRENPIFSPLAEVIKAFADIDIALGKFREAHMLLALEQIGQQKGTGGSTGVAYLKKQFAVQLAFPEFHYITNHANLNAAGSLTCWPQKATASFLSTVKVGVNQTFLSKSCPNGLQHHRKTHPTGAPQPNCIVY